MLLNDHGILRVLYLNLHRVGAQGWRSAQPAPYQIKKLKERGVNTIVTLRGGVLFGAWPLEREACERHGIKLEKFVMRSRDLPTREELLELVEFLRSVEKPVAYHCKSGADRAGIMSVLHLILVEGQSVAIARKQLSLRFGHLSIGPTGILDRFVDEAARAEARGVDFLTWVTTEYDREKLTKAYKGNGWKHKFGQLLTDRLIRRE